MQDMILTPLALETSYKTDPYRPNTHPIKEQVYGPAGTSDDRDMLRRTCKSSAERSME